MGKGVGLWCMLGLFGDEVHSSIELELESKILGRIQNYLFSWKAGLMGGLNDEFVPHLDGEIKVIHLSGQVARNVARLL